MYNAVCAAYKSADGNIAIAVCGGELISARVGGRELTINEMGDPLVWEQIARRVNPDYEHYQGMGDLQIATEAMAQLPCEECPWAKYCEDMDKDIDE